MTTFQMFALGLFVVLVALAYGKDIYSKVRSSLPAWPTLPSPFVPAPPASNNVQTLVDDLVVVASLRDRLAASGCQEGADACTILLKLIVDHKHPHGS